MRTESAAFVIEVEGIAAGLVRRENGGFRFFAADANFRSIDRKHFASAKQAAYAVGRIMPSRSGKTPGGSAAKAKTAAERALTMLSLLRRSLSRLGTALAGASARGGGQPESRTRLGQASGPTRPASSPSAPTTPSIVREPEQGASRSQAVAIVGAGFSGSLLALHLLRQGRSAPRIYLLERQPSFGRGLAYSTGNPGHRVNTRAANMSAFPDQPNHFVEWLSAYAREHRLEQPTGYSFVSRRVYGAYIESVLRAEISDPLKAGRLILVPDEVVGIDRDGELMTLLTAGGRTYRARRLVLAMGKLAPGQSEGAYRGDPWDPSAIEGIPADGSVLIVGTGLTMVDVVQSLIDAGHEGPITAISRRGLLPHVHALTPAWNLDERQLPKTASLTAMTVWLRTLVARAEAEGVDWRGVIDSLRPYVDELWGKLPVEERRRFLRHLRPYWDIHRHRAAPQVNALLNDALARGQLTALAGRIVEMEPDGDGATVRFRRRGARTAENMRVHRVIDCTGPASGFRGGGSPVIDALLSRGWARPDPLNLGLEVDNDSALIEADGSTSHRLYALGPLARGTFWENVAVPDIRGQCTKLAHHMGTVAASASSQ